jgi:hypothetical protein
MDYRHKEEPKLWFRSERFFRCNGNWYFHTREGFAVGPYQTRIAAEVDAGLLIDQLRNTPADRAVTVIRDFIMHTGGELDYVNDPAFTGYLVSEDDTGYEELRP